MRSGLVAAALLGTLAAPASATPRPQVVDPAHDANGGAYWRNPDTPTPVGSQEYADVTSVHFRTTTDVRVVGRRAVRVVTGFTVTLTLTAPPTPPGDAVGVYRVLAFGPGCLFAIDHYTRAPAGGPQTAVQDWCADGTIRRSPLPRPAVSGSTLTWTVPLTALPKSAKVGVGVTLTNLHFETLVRPAEPACAGDPGTPAEEQQPCAVRLDDTFNRTATYTVR